MWSRHMAYTTCPTEISKAARASQVAVRPENMLRLDSSEGSLRLAVPVISSVLDSSCLDNSRSQFPLADFQSGNDLFRSNQELSWGVDVAHFRQCKATYKALH